MSFTKSNSIVVFPAFNFTEEIVSVLFGTIGEIQYSYYEMNNKETPKYWISYSSSFFAQNAVQLRNNIEINGNRINVISAPKFIKDKSKKISRYKRFDDSEHGSVSNDEADASDSDDEVELPEISKKRKNHNVKVADDEILHYDPVKDDRRIDSSAYENDKKSKEFQDYSSDSAPVRVRREESSSTSSSESDNYEKRRRRHKSYHKHKHHSSKNHHRRHH